MNNVVKLVENKTCIGCGVIKPLSAFRQNMGRNHDSIAKKCESCFSQMRKATWQKKRVNDDIYRASLKEKECNLCGFVKPLSEFNKDRTHLDGIAI